MEVPFDDAFDEQRTRFALRFTCEHCAHYDETSGACAHGFPNRVHCLSHYTGTPRPETIVFCKDFDLA